jgi:hypothetical protein
MTAHKNNIKTLTQHINDIKTFTHLWGIWFSNVHSKIFRHYACKQTIEKSDGAADEVRVHYLQNKQKNARKLKKSQEIKECQFLNQQHI